MPRVNELKVKANFFAKTLQHVCTVDQYCKKDGRATGIPETAQDYL